MKTVELLFLDEIWQPMLSELCIGIGRKYGLNWIDYQGDNLN